MINGEEQWSRSEIRLRKGVFIVVQGRGKSELLAYSQVVSWVNDVIDIVILGNEVYLEKDKEEMIISEDSKR